MAGPEMIRLMAELETISWMAGLAATGWKVVRVWEHELARGNATNLRRRLRRALP
jgi:G:T-mismatch repair DNA endonuclease (very short patch repair protein)